ncbi:MAG TPA: YhdP family protein [Steroidobacteraceae bacterium]
MKLAKLGKIVGLCAAGLVALLLILMLALKLILDRAPEYQAQIKDWFYGQTGYHIGFAHVSPAFRWYGPELYFDRLELRSKDDQRVLARANGGRVAADVWQLIRSGKLLAGRIEVDSPRIAVARLGPTRFAVASEIELGGDDSSRETLRIGDLPAGKLVIRRAVLTMQNWNPSLPLLNFEDVNIELRRDGEDLAVTFTAQLPEALGGTVSFQAAARGGGDLQEVSWNAMARARAISFPGWRRLLPEYLGNLESGNGSFELAAAGRGAALTRANLDFSATNVAAKPPGGPTVKFDQMSGDLSFTHSADRWSLSGKRVRVGRADPESAFDVSWRQGDDGLVNLSAGASYLRAETLLPLAGLLPQKDLRDSLREIAPSGVWTDTSIAFQRDKVGDPWRMQVQANFQRAGYAAVGAAPGLRGLAGSIAGNESGGHVYIDTNVAEFNWPAQFAKPVELEIFKAILLWKRTPQGLLVAGPEWRLKTHDGELHGKGSWQQFSDGSSPVLTLIGEIQNGNVANARNYLPHGLIAPPTFEWLSRALYSGRMPHASVLFQGPVKRFPFRERDGIFLARCTLEGMILDYGEGWQPLDNLTATAEFRDEGMTARLISGRIGEVALDSVDADFHDFNSGELKIHAAAHGDAANALNYLRSTPLDAIAEHSFSNVEAAGPLRATIDLFFPFKEFDHKKVLIHGDLDGATVNKTGSPIKAAAVTGDFDIDGGQVAHADVRGELLGGSFVMQARAPRKRPLTRTQLDFRGTVDGDQLRAALSLPAASLAGQTEWRAVVKITPEPARERSVRVTSNLTGLEIRLPAPVGKAAAAPMPSVFDIQWPAVGGPRGNVALGTLASSSYALDSGADGMRLAHASVIFGGGDSAPDETQLIDVSGSIQRLDLAGWLRLSTPDKDAKPLSYYLHNARLNVAELDYLGLAFRDVSLDLAVTERSWRINSSGPNVAGSITIPNTAGAADPWVLQFDRLRFDVAGTDDSPNAGPDANGFSDPRAIPAVSFYARQLIWGERNFGDVTAMLVKLDDGASLKSLTVVDPHFTVNAQGEWRGKDAGVSRIQGTLNSSDVQNTLKDLGYAEVIQAKAGKVEFNLSWPGPPTAQALAQVAGHVTLSFDHGQITGLSPGAGRVLGLASIAALPRRLALDFSDLTDKGLAFDSVHGDFDLRDGNAYTENVLLKGPAAEIGLIGRVGLKNKDYDQIAVVTGNGASSLAIPAAGALVGGPVVGAAVLLFTQVFKQPLNGLTRGYYRITGSWDNPTVERIKSTEAKSAEAAAASTEAPK